MTKEEWLKNDNSFYHITETKNLEGIFKKGLQNRNGQGICVVRSRDVRIVRYICETMLNISDEQHFSIIEIKPSKHNLKVSHIKNDNVEEITNKLHNYLKVKKLNIDSDDIVDTYQANSLGIPNLQTFEAEIQKAGLIEGLE